ncbi:MAG TPA: cytochrome c [Gammaproteobacteria bacterium]|nr:cytochrome c [Gammaproteobacteria bacterium]HIL19135.1 cytochrome c [Gammaproteobacteria bacterium]
MRRGSLDVIKRHKVGPRGWLSEAIVLLLSIWVLTVPNVVWAETTVSGDAEAAVFSPEYMADVKNIELGKTLWQKQCRHCHGASAYPGKAPKLKPYKYKPAFVYKRITNGFRKMPSWKAVFSTDERRAIVTYVMDNQFSP